MENVTEIGRERGFKRKGESRWNDKKERKRRKDNALTTMKIKNRKKRESRYTVQQRKHLQLKHVSKYGAHVPC